MALTTRPQREPPSSMTCRHWRHRRRHSPVSATRPRGLSASSRSILELLFSYSTLCAFTLLITSNELPASRHTQAGGLLKPLIHTAEASQTPQRPQASSLTSSSNSNSNNLYQAVSQMYQVFNGNDSQTLDGTHLKVFELSDEDTLLVGSRPTEDAYGLCKLKGKSLEKCQNYIMVIKKVAPDTLLICGTNAYSPKCRHYNIGLDAYELVAEMPGEGVCPYHEGSPFTATFTDGQLYSATAVGFTGVDYLIHRPPLRTEQYNPKSLNAPHFVSSFRYGDHVYFLFREVATEHINCGKTIYSRVARVCANDAGGTATWNRERWTSFAKVRLNCSIPGEFPFYFDEIQASTQVLQSAYLPAGQSSATPTAAPSGGGQSATNNNHHHHQNNQDLIYAVFTTPTNSIGGSAICAYKMGDILAAFEGPFKGQLEGGNSNWLPVPESRVPQPRPGSCSLDSKRMSEESINFIRDNPLMDTAVAPIWAQPLITMASISFRFTQIAVDVKVETSQVYGAPALRTDVIFVSTDDGRVLKLMNSYHLMNSNQVHRVLTSAGSSSLYTRAPPASSSAPSQAQSQPQSPVASSLLSAARPATAQVVAGPSRQFPDTLPDVSANTVIIEELHLFDQRTPVTGLMIYRPREPASSDHNAGGKLIVMSTRQIKAVPLSRCERALTCTDCLGLYDPYCVWDLQQQACLSMGRSAARLDVSAGPFQDFRQTAPPRMAWASPSPYQTIGAAPVASNNHTLAWWSSASFCPTPPSSDQQPATGHQQSIGFPYRSMFSSHLQVPSRFDYASGHHLSRTSLVALPQISPLGPAGPSQSAGRPASECLTMCGGVYSAPIGTPSVGPPTSDTTYSGCADYFASASNSLLYQQQQQQQPNLIGYAGTYHQIQPPIQQQQMQNLYTSENLKWAVIICTLIGLILGLTFGYVLAKSTRSKQGDSICSSTFDETNLYMASTGSHGCHTTASGLFAPLTHHSSYNHHHQPNSTVARLTNHPAFLASQQQQHQQQQSLGCQPLMPTSNGLLLASANNYSTGLQPSRGQQQAFETAATAAAAASQSLLGSEHSSGIGSSTYANHFQAGKQHERTPSVRTGALPPIPTGQPLVLANAAQTTHLNRAQLTPNSSTGGSQKTSTTGSSDSHQSAGSQSTLQTSDQQYYQQITGTLNGSHHQNGSSQMNPNQLHQRSFTSNSNGNGGGGGGQLAKPVVSNSTFLQSNQQQQQQQQQQQPNNKIFL